MKDRMDEAIDVVAARMTNVAEDEGLALRIAQALPERSQWLPYGWVTRFAVGALATLAIIVVLRTFDGGSTNVLRTEGATAPTPIVERPSNDRRTPVEPPPIARRTPVEPPLIVRRTIVEQPLNVRRTTPEAPPDFERSLEALDAPKALALSSLAPQDLASEAPLEVESLVIADLPLSSDFPPR